MQDTKPFYILSCNGGGVKGLITVTFLYQMSKYMKTIDPSFKLYNFFDMYAGTSIGAIIIGLILVNKYEEDDIVTIFNKNTCKEMLDKSIWDEILGLAQTQPKYDGTNKKTFLEKNVDNNKFNTIDKHFIVPTYNITQRRAIVFDSTTANDKVLTADILDASSAAPCYFPCVKINNSNTSGKPIKNDWFIDGGIVCNNPTICCIGKANKIIRNTNRKIIVINIFNGYKNNIINGEKAKNYGGIEWLQNDIIDIAMDESIIIEQTIDLLDKDCYIEINGPLENASDNLDDTSETNMDELIKKGNDWWIMNKYKFDRIFKNNIQDEL